MDTDTFLSRLRGYADRFSESPQDSDEFDEFFGSNYGVYISATTEERARIRDFVRSPPQSDGKFSSSLRKLFQPSSRRRPIAHLLLIYAKDRALVQLGSTKDVIWLYRGLAALSMDNFSGSFRDRTYIGAPGLGLGHAGYLLADLYVTGEECRLDPGPAFHDMAEISDPGAKEGMIVSMREYMGMTGQEQRILLEDRRTNGRFTGWL